MPIVLSPISSTASGRYFSQSGIEAIYGVQNVAIWSNKEGTGNTADPVAIAAAGAYAENYFDQRLRQANYAAPLASTSADFAVWCDLVNELAGVRLYLGRGEAQQTDTKGLAGQMESHRLHAINELEQMLFAGIDCPRASGYTDAPIAVSATVNPDGSPRAAGSPYVRPQWNGYMWVWGT